MITKQLIRFFHKDDPRRVKYNEVMNKIEGDLESLETKPEWYKKHSLGANAVITLSVFWRIVIKPIDDAEDAGEELTKPAIKLRKRFYKWIKRAKIHEDAYKMDTDVMIEERLERMSVMAND